MRVDFLSVKHVPQILCGVPQNTTVCPAEKFFLVGKYENGHLFKMYIVLVFTCTYYMWHQIHKPALPAPEREADVVAHN